MILICTRFGLSIYHKRVYSFTCFYKGHQVSKHCLLSLRKIQKIIVPCLVCIITGPLELYLMSQIQSAKLPPPLSLSYPSTLSQNQLTLAFSSPR